MPSCRLSPVGSHAAFAAIGLQYYSLRFIDAGQGIKNVMQLSKAEITKIRHLEDEYGLNVATLGSPIGKVKLRDQDDGTKNRYVPFKKYLAEDVKKVCELAHAFERSGHVEERSSGDHADALVVHGDGRRPWEQ